MVQRGPEQGAGTGQLPVGPRIPPDCLPQEAPQDASSRGVFTAGSGEVGAGTEAYSIGVIYFSPRLKVCHREAICRIKAHHSFIQQRRLTPSLCPALRSGQRCRGSGPGPLGRAHTRHCRPSRVLMGGQKKGGGSSLGGATAVPSQGGHGHPGEIGIQTERGGRTEGPGSCSAGGDDASSLRF